MSGREVLILERERQFGTITSSRNSEVIHAGIYYPPGSLKAKLCVAGREQLYAYAGQHHVAHKRVGKLIVATNSGQMVELDRLKGVAEVNGVEDLEWLDQAKLSALEPELNSVGALLSPSTGIIDSHGYMLSLLGEAESRGAVIAYGAELAAARPNAGGLRLELADGGGAVGARLLVNAAGLHAPSLARSIDSFPESHTPRESYAKGNYFSLAGRTPFRHLIYPVPEPGGLGVHLTLDLAGLARFGPDVQWIETLDYSVDPRRGDVFYARIRNYWPGLPDGALQPAYCGIRPKLSVPGEEAADFVISGPEQHGFPGVINLFGIESPGLTASLALAEEVARMADIHLS